MSVIIAASVAEQSSVKIQIEFKDPENGDAITPISARYTLLTVDGDVVNDREEEAITPALIMTIFLAGDDLMILDDSLQFEPRILTVEGTYSNGSATMPVTQEFLFQVTNLRVFPKPVST